MDVIEENAMQELITFNDILIVPKFSDIESRKEVDLSIDTNPKHTFRSLYARFPVISSNMDTVTGSSMARAMLNYGGQACLHRFLTIEDNVKMFNESEILVEEDSYIRPMVSIGLGKAELDRAYALYSNNATKFVIDVAHGAQKSVVEQAKNLRDIIKDYGSITVGNFASAESVKTFLEYSGDIVDAIKIGVGPGSACTTRVKTGIGYPQFSAILEISNLLKNTNIATIADGGMKTPGDIAKALGAGASMVMLGGMLAGTDESPGEIVLNLNKDTAYKQYRGSASKEAYESQNKEGSHRTAEGESFSVPYKGSVINVLQDIEGGLRSAFSYTGSRNLKEFHKRCEFIKVSSASYVEGTPHGKSGK